MMNQNERSSKVNNTDRRVKRTKKALRDALFLLLKKKTINQITVTELTDMADVNRATFYFYYTDLYDMLEQIQNEAYELFMTMLIDSGSALSSFEELAEYITRFLVFCRENDALCRFVINNDTNNQLYRRIQNAILTNVPRSKDIFAENDPRRYLTNFAINAMTGLVIDWLDEGMQIEPRPMAEFMTDVFLKGAPAAKRDYKKK